MHQTYRVKAQLRDGTELTLLKELPEATQALFIEQSLERSLGIADRDVAGELPR